ncbi:LOW QUALITY PROTEIN: putative tubulin polyglutamylase TTLL2 [Passerculus sandwichensis]
MTDCNRQSKATFSFMVFHNVYDKFKPWLLELNQNTALFLGCSMDDTVRRKLFQVLLNCKQIDTSRPNQVAGMNAGRRRVPWSKAGERPGLLAYEKVAKCTSASSPQPALQAARGCIPKVAVLTKKTTRALPRKTLTSRCRINGMPKIPFQAKGEAKNKQIPGAGHSPCKSAQLSWWLSTPDFCNYELITQISSDEDQRPTPLAV